GDHLQRLRFHGVAFDSGGGAKSLGEERRALSELVNDLQASPIRHRAALAEAKFEAGGEQLPRETIGCDSEYDDEKNREDDEDDARDVAGRLQEVSRRRRSKRPAGRILAHRIEIWK